ncbi:Retrovirus-related Pol polyprotein from transposon 412 [Frankliniella fusca]|uniref:Retrovirus-related Pol polyprotein from transposon 412 n=1 Tax=Frankliniella fusca TaxID=407009 RepID=A0AAE1H6N9_9NEOP|nr:Retrovirus-related Pol polyprotein from transposon 412 [Frankliniella fusca]
MQAQGAFENAASTVLRGPRPVTAVLDGNELSIACFEGPIHEECLLGGDFVAAHVTAVDVQGDRLLLRNGGIVPLTRVSTPAAAISAVLEVHCDHSTVVAPHSSAIVSVSVSGRDFFGMPADGHPCALPVAPELAILGPRGEAALVGGGGGAGQKDAPCGPVGAPRDAPCGPVGAPRDAACGPVGAPREAACGPVGTSGEHACGPAVASGSRSGAPVRVLRTRCASLPADLPPGLAVTSTLLADADGRALVVTVRNDADRPLTLRRGAHIGSLRVSALLPAYVGATMAEDAAAGVVLPAPLQALQDACSADLSEHEVVQVRQLLLEFQDSDGAVERLIRTVVTQLGILTDANQSDWDLQVPLVLLSLRVARHSTTGVSPAMMLLGRELRLPPTLSQSLHPDTPDISTAREYPAWLRDRLHGLHHEVRERAWQAALASKERYDVRARRPAFAVGDLVWLYDPKRRRGRNPKLQCWWSGPHRITAMINDVVARLVDPARPRSRPRTVHVDRLAPAAPRQT